MRSDYPPVPGTTGDILDFSAGINDWGNYSGSQRKRRLILDGVVYMLKYPDSVRDLHGSLSHFHNQFSEYVGYHIYESAGIPVQKTYLGTCLSRGKEFTAVACRDFRNDGLKLYPMKFIHPSNPWKPARKTGRLTILQIYETVHDLENPDLEAAAIQHFWKMFVIDCLIGNCDRDLENWGMAMDQNGNRFPAPVYDCGSSLLAVTSDEQLQEEIGTGDFTGKSLNLYTPFGTEDNRCRLSFRDMLESPNPELEQAILEVFPRIDLAEIYQILQDTPFMSEIRKTAMMESIKIRYNQVLLKAWVKAAHPALSDHDQRRLISRIKSASNAGMRKRGYRPLSEA